MTYNKSKPPLFIGVGATVLLGLLSLGARGFSGTIGSSRPDLLAQVPPMGQTVGPQPLQEESSSLAHTPTYATTQPLNIPLSDKSYTNLGAIYDICLDDCHEQSHQCTASAEKTFYNCVQAARGDPAAQKACAKPLLEIAKACQKALLGCLAECESISPESLAIKK
jgi:hypothetical protein